MVKYICIACLALLLAGSWYLFYRSGNKERDIGVRIELLTEQEDPRGLIPELESEMRNLEGVRIFNGILLCLFSAGIVGIFFVNVVLPYLFDKVTYAVRGDVEVAPDPFHAAHVLMAQGEWERAIEAFKKAATENPPNRIPYIEIAKIQKFNLEDPVAAIMTLREAVEGHEWQDDDAALLMFRLAELYDEDTGGRDAATAILKQVMVRFPGTRHAASARTKLHERGMS